MKELVSRFFKFSIGSLGAAVLNLMLIPLTTHFLSPAEYGKTSLFFLLQTFLIYVIYFGFDQAFTREFHEYPDKKKLLLNAMIFPFMQSVGLVLILCLFAPFFSSVFFHNPYDTMPFYLLAVFIVVSIFERFIFLYVRMENQAIRFSFYNIMVKGMVLIGTGIALMLFSANYLTVLYGMLVGQIIGDILLIAINGRLFTWKGFQLDLVLLNRMAKFGVPIVVATLIYGVFLTLDRVFLMHYLDYKQLGLYTAAYKIASALLILQVSFSNFWIPTAYEWYKQKKPIRYYKMISDAVMLGASIFFLLLLLFKKWIIVILSPEYMEAQFIFPFLCFYPLMMMVSETTTLGIVFKKKSYLNIVVSIVSLIASIALYIWLTPLLGVMGIAIAVGTAFIVYFLARTILSMMIWKGFSVKKHVITIILMYAVCLYDVFGKQSYIQEIVVLGTILILLVLYRNLVINIIHPLTRMRVRKKKGNDII